MRQKPTWRMHTFPQSTRTSELYACTRSANSLDWDSGNIRRTVLYSRCSVRFKPCVYCVPLHNNHLHRLVIIVMKYTRTSSHAIANDMRSLLRIRIACWMLGHHFASAAERTFEVLISQHLTARLIVPDKQFFEKKNIIHLFSTLLQ